MDTLTYLILVLCGAIWQSLLPYIPALLLVSGAFFTARAILAWRHGNMRRGLFLSGLALLGAGLWCSWPQGKYTAQEDTAWLTLQGTIPAEAKLVCKTFYYSITNTSECTERTPFFNISLTGHSERSSKRISYEEDIAWSNGAYRVNVPQKVRLGSCEYELSRMQLLNNGRLLLTSSMWERDGNNTITATEPTHLTCRDSPWSTKVMLCSSDIPDQPWNSNGITHLDTYNPHNEDVDLTVNIDFEAPGTRMR